MNHNWYIGQDIVCIKSFEGAIKDSVYTIRGLTKCCKCVDVAIDIGMVTNGRTVGCNACNITLSNVILWYAEKIFLPLDTLVDISEIEEVLKKPAYQL